MKLISMNIIDSLNRVLEGFAEKTLLEEVKTALRVIDPSAQYQLLSRLNSFITNSSNSSPTHSSGEDVANSFESNNLRQVTRQASNSSTESEDNKGRPFASLKNALDQTGYWKNIQENASYKLRALFQQSGKLKDVLGPSCTE